MLMRSRLGPRAAFLRSELGHGAFWLAWPAPGPLFGGAIPHGAVIDRDERRMTLPVAGIVLCSRIELFGCFIQIGLRNRADDSFPEMTNQATPLPGFFIVFAKEARRSAAVHIGARRFGKGDGRNAAVNAFLQEFFFALDADCFRRFLVVCSRSFINTFASDGAANVKDPTAFEEFERHRCVSQIA